MKQNKDSLRVGGLVPLSTIDYPGLLSTVVFCQGCPWRCGYCHNKSLLPVKPVDGGKEFSWSSILDLLSRRQGLCDAVVFSGGEPTMQEALLDAVCDVSKLGFKIGLHTSGAFPMRLQQLLGFVDWIGLDVKAPRNKYREIAGAASSGLFAWESAQLVISSGVSYQLRITNDTSILNQDDIATIKQDLLKIGANPNSIVVQECRR